MKTILRIEGMTCEHCAAHVTEALKAVAGVSAVKVNLKKKTGVVKHGESTSLDALKAAAAEAGFEASLEKA